MDNKNFQTASNIIFCLLVAGLFYFMPFIAWHTMKGDKTDIIMGMGFGFIPLGLLLLSFLHGFFCKKIFAPGCMASILGIPVIFIPVVAGNTVLERGLSLGCVIMMIFAITCISTVSGIFTHWLLKKVKLLPGTLS